MHPRSFYVSKQALAITRHRSLAVLSVKYRDQTVLHAANMLICWEALTWESTGTGSLLPLLDVRGTACFVLQCVSVTTSV